MTQEEDSIHARQQLRIQLLELWQVHEKKRAMGGRWATSGVALQAHIFLLRFFEGVAANRLEPSELAELEGLSDILVPEHEQITLVQVKRTLDKKSLVSALEEAYLITKLCQEQCPEALKVLQFQIAYRHRNTQLSPVDIDVLELFGGTASVDVFTAMLAAQHSAPLIEYIDHHDRLYLLLWTKGIRTPQGLIDKAMGRLMDAFLTPTNFSLARLARELAELFLEAPRREAWTFRGKLLSSSDVAAIPDFIGHDVLVGERVSFEYIRKGYVKGRPVVFDPLIAQFRAWLESLSHRDGEVRDKIPVFWIDGRSGDGKSVLLFQLVQTIQNEAVDLPILHLPSGNALLDILGSPPAFDHQTVLVLVDDVYDLADRTLWEERIRECVQIDVPRVALLTCGPTEQCDQFAAGLADVFEIARYTLPHMNAQERSEFGAWFEQRTGKKRRVVDGEANKLLVQVMFELEQGEELKTFSLKFKRRLERLDLYNVVRTIVAVNALYQDAPLELLESERQRVALTRLGANDQLHFYISEGGDGDSGVRIAHPHLAWLLFTEWRDPLYTLDELWAISLAAAMRVHLNCGRASAAGKVVQYLASTPRLDGESSKGTTRRREAIASLYRYHVKGNGNRPDFGIVHAWLQTLQEDTQLRLLPDPVLFAQNALASVNGDDMQRSRIAGALWTLAITRPAYERDEILEKVRTFFIENSQAEGVPHVLAYLVAKGFDEGIRQLAGNWLDENCTHPSALTLLNTWIPRAKDAERVVAQALAWLEANRNNAKGYLVIGPILNRSSGQAGAAMAFALEWIGSNRQNPNVYHVLAAMVANHGDDEDAVKAALAWVRSDLRHPKVHQVISTLLSKATDETSLLAIAMQWLSENPQHPGIANVYAPLISEWPGSADVINFGKTWLARSQGHNAFPEILGAVVTHSKNDLELIEFAEASLQNLERSRCVPVIVALLYGGRASPAHVKRALDFAETEDGLSRKKFALRGAGTALAHHPRSMADCLNAGFTEEQKKILCDSTALALTEYRARIEPFFDEVCRSLTGWSLGMLLKAAISMRLMPGVLGSHVAEWLVKNHHRRGYKTILRELKRHGEVYEYALRTRRLSADIQQDYMLLEL